MKILIIGGAGFVGSNIAIRLHSQGHRVLVVDDLSFGYADNLPSDLHFVKMDQKDIPQPILDEHEVMINMACSNIIYAMEHQNETYQNNIGSFLDCAQRFKGKIIYASTASVYGDAHVIPTPEDGAIILSNAYSSSKRYAERWLALRGNYTTLRLSNVYGPKQRPENPYCGVMGRFMNNFLNNEPIQIYGDGKATRDYTYVDDVFGAVEMAMEKPALNTEINIASGTETSVLHLVETIIGKSNHPYYFGRPRKIDTISRRCLDITKAKELLGWEPLVSLEEGMMLTKLYMQSSKK